MEGGKNKTKLELESLARTHLQHAAKISKAFQLVRYAHAELFGPRFHGAPNHEAVAWLKDMQRAGDGGEGHGAHKDGHFLVQTTEDSEGAVITGGLGVSKH